MTKFSKLLSLAIVSFIMTCAYSQSRLVFTGTYNGVFHPLDSIVVEDINTGSRILKVYPDTVLKLLMTGTG